MATTGDRGRADLLGVLLATALCGSVAWGQSSSPSYVLRQSVLAMAAGGGASASYRLGASAGQCVAAGTAGGADVVLASGFFGDLAPGPVPVVLALRRNPLDLLAADLSWSGNAPRYHVLAFDGCVIAPGSLLATTVERSLDGVTTPAVLTCFDVVPSLRRREAHRSRPAVDYLGRGDARE